MLKLLVNKAGVRPSKWERKFVTLKVLGLQKNMITYINYVYWCYVIDSKTLYPSVLHQTWLSRSSQDVLGSPSTSTFINLHVSKRLEAFKRGADITERTILL